VKRIRIGDVVEIPTAKGLAYAQYSHKKEQWGSLLRILPGTFGNRPEDLAAVVRQKELFVTFFPLGAAVSRGIFEIVGNEPVPEAARAFPLFRAAGFVDRQGRVHGWYLWDGDREWRIGELSDEQRSLPIRSVWNDTALIEAIEEGWTPATDRRSQG
jgi:hypothetical protein